MRKDWRQFIETLDTPVKFLHRDEFYTTYDSATDKIAVKALPGITITRGTSPVDPGTYIYEIKDSGLPKKYRINMTLEKQFLPLTGKTRITTTINSVCELPYN